MERLADRGRAGRASGSRSPGPQQIRVVARYADGHERDVTRLASYRVNDDATLVDRPRRPGRLAPPGRGRPVVRYQSQVVSARLATFINPDLDFDFARLKRRNFIDDELFKRLESLKVPPSPPASDAAFLRRVSLDLTGEQPRPSRSASSWPIPTRTSGSSWSTG